MSRFGELGPPWAYSKAEGLALGEYASQGFTHVITEAPTVPGFAQIDALPGFAGIDAPRSLGAALSRVGRGSWPLGLRTRPAVYIHRRVRREGGEGTGRGGV